MVVLLNKIQSVLITVILLFSAWYVYTIREDISILHWFFPEVPIIDIGDVPVRVEIADSHEERVQGLSGKQEMGKVNGLLFIYPEADYHAMWMKDMRFAIDIIWISEDFRVVSIDKNLSPDTYPRLYRPEKPAKYAVETDVYFSESLGIVPGDIVRIPSRYLEK